MTPKLFVTEGGDRRSRAVWMETDAVTEFVTEKGRKRAKKNKEDPNQVLLAETLEIITSRSTASAVPQMPCRGGL